MQQSTSLFSSSFMSIVITSVISVTVTLAVVIVVPRFLPHTPLGQLLNNTATSAQTVTTPAVVVSNESIPDMVMRVTPAVVSVIATADVPVVEQYFEEYNPWGGFFGGPGFSIPRQRQVGTEKQEVGGGSGFFVSADGYVVTNRHVVDAANVEYSIMTNDGETFPVTIVAKDTALDIALLKVDSDEVFPFVTFATSSTPRLGESVVAIGNALAQFPNSVSVGVVSGLSRDIVAGDNAGSTESLEGVIQTDAAINRGNSGGPLLNTAGEVIGVNVAVARNGENIGFAIPAVSVANVYQSVKEHGEIIRPFIGVRYLQIDATVAKKNNLDRDYGVLVVRGETRDELAVMPGSPADKAGLVENDIILEINNQKLDGSRTFASIIRDFTVGETITLKVLQDGTERDISVTLAKAPTE